MNAADTHSQAIEDVNIQRLRMAGAYGRLFSGQGTAKDAALVLDNLGGHCGARRSPFRFGAADDTARAIGRLEVWQHIENFRFPDGRPEDAKPTTRRRREGNRHGRSEQAAGGSSSGQPGRGISEQTDD